MLRDSLNEPTHIDLFSGIGGFALAAQWAGFRTVAFCEIDKYCQKVLARNFPYTRSYGCPRDKITENGFESTQGRETQCKPDSPNSPSIYSDIFDFDGKTYQGASLLTGGFPCQPFSVAGKRRGKDDDRHLWPEMLRIIKETRPAWVLGENVPGIIKMELDNTLTDLEGIGYATRAFVIPASAVDARHRRDRVWIIARDMGDTERTRQSPRFNGSGKGKPRGADIRSECRWLPEPDVGRVAARLSNDVDRLRALGNSIVPQVAHEILIGIREQIK